MLWTEKNLKQVKAVLGSTVESNTVYYENLERKTELL